MADDCCFPKRSTAIATPILIRAILYPLLHNGELPPGRGCRQRGPEQRALDAFVLLFDRPLLLEVLHDSKVAAKRRVRVRAPALMTRKNHGRPRYDLALHNHQLPRSCCHAETGIRTLLSFYICACCNGVLFKCFSSLSVPATINDWNLSSKSMRIMA